jgi:hypothetical protein
LTISLVTEENYTPEQAAKNLGVHFATLRQCPQVPRRREGY